MSFEKLFKVLVMGGALIGCDAEAPATDAAPSDALGTDALAVDAAADSPEGDALVNGGDPLCFCPADCCDGPTPKPGIECCWSTSC